MFRCSLADVLAWPASHIELILAFLRSEPSTEDRIEYGIAQLTAQHFNRTRQEGEDGRHVADFLPFAKAWAAPEASPLDAQVMGRIDSIGRRNSKE